MPSSIQFPGFCFARGQPWQRSANHGILGILGLVRWMGFGEGGNVQWVDLSIGCFCCGGGHGGKYGGVVVVCAVEP
jgi:hypothetical protein